MVGVQFKEGSGGFGVVWCRPGVRLKAGSGGSEVGQGKVSRKVPEVVGWSGAGVRFKAGFRGFGVVW